jgi:hypothetical protein
MFHEFIITIGYHDGQCVFYSLPVEYVSTLMGRLCASEHAGAATMAFEIREGNHRPRCIWFSLRPRLRPFTQMNHCFATSDISVVSTKGPVGAEDFAPRRQAAPFLEGETIKLERAFTVLADAFLWYFSWG